MNRILSEPTSPRVTERNRIEEARATFQKAPYAGLRQVEFHSCGNSVVLTGSVSSFYLKQLAQSWALALCGPEYSLENRLHVEGSTSAEEEFVRDDRPRIR